MSEGRGDDILDLGEIDPGHPPLWPPPREGSHPWAPSEFDRRERVISRSDFSRAQAQATRRKIIHRKIKSWRVGRGKV